MQMPDMNGIELARALEKDPAIPPAKKILLSSVGNEEEREMQGAGISACVKKPFRKSQLYNSILAVSTESLPDPGSTPVEELSVCGTRVLLAEDNLVNQQLAVEMLRSLRLETDVVNDGLKALEAWKKHRYGMILMDCQMPGLDGYGATQAIREAEKSESHVPIIALTAHAMEGDRERCLAAGMDDYLSKPFSREQLSEMVSRWLEVPENGDSERSQEKPVQMAPSSDAKRAPDQSFVDDKALEQIRALDQDGSAGILGRVLQIYLSDSPKLLERVNDAIQSRDPEELRNSAHSLKSSSAQVGAFRLSELCKQLEAIGREDDTAGAEAILLLAQKEYTGVQDALQQQIGD
jgi:CheY-like chemotaxis protein